MGSLNQVTRPAKRVAVSKLSVQVGYLLASSYIAAEVYCAHMHIFSDQRLVGLIGVYTCHIIQPLSASNLYQPFLLAHIVLSHSSFETEQLACLWPHACKLMVLLKPTRDISAAYSRCLLLL